MFSPCGQYRYLLARQWDAGSGTCLFVMLNPSTADALSDDPTIRRCSGLAQRWGFRRLEVVNLFAGISSTPAGLFAMKDPCGPDNDAHIRAAADRADTIVAAWGNHGVALGRDSRILELFRGSGKQVSCLRLNRNGTPGHPLYVPGNIHPKWFT